ncbi:hypothetical protein SPF06_19085 [Sinomonas sp. JGH33]|uniref:PRC-barrel domain-containing protein n=1 Tax=Sinomonas terricola TaxID=3110330 RepID=A0ABU5TAX4_9MICC|nr:hypothetical protein [Sinomonas sp. JGH33]MEA5456832.1 hypothetical protein [Sinomonas sp. JGH33]
MSLLEQVQVGMSVIDADGDELGKVEFVRAPDPKSAAFEERVASIHGLIGLGIGSIVGIEPKVPPEMALRFFRKGYLKIAAPHFWAENYYAAGDAIERVEGRTVYLSLNRHGLDAQE